MAKNVLGALYGVNPLEGATSQTYNPALDVITDGIRSRASRTLGPGGLHDQCKQGLFYRIDTPMSELSGLRTSMSTSAASFVGKYVRAGGDADMFAPSTIMGEVLYHILGLSTVDTLGGAMVDMAKTVSAIASPSGDLWAVFVELFGGLGRTATTMAVLQSSVAILRAVSVLSRLAERRLLADTTISSMVNRMAATGAPRPIILGRAALGATARSLSLLYSTGAQAAQLVAVGGSSRFGIPAVALAAGTVHIAAGLIRFVKGSYESAGPLPTDYIGLGLRAVVPMAAFFFAGRWAIRSGIGQLEAIGQRRLGREVEPSAIGAGIMAVVSAANNAWSYVPNMGTRILGSILFEPAFFYDSTFRRKTIEKMRDPVFVIESPLNAGKVLAYEIFGKTSNVILLNLFFWMFSGFKLTSDSHSTDVAAAYARIIQEAQARGAQPDVSIKNLVAQAAGVAAPGVATRTLRTMEDARSSIELSVAAQCDAAIRSTEGSFVEKFQVALRGPGSSLDPDVFAEDGAWTQYLQLAQTNGEWQERLIAISDQIRRDALPQETADGARLFFERSADLFLGNDDVAALPS